MKERRTSLADVRRLFFCFYDGAISHAFPVA